MSNSKEFDKQSYARGYSAGSRGAWPEHRPPLPPDEKVQALVVAARELRDAADTVCARLQEDDEFVQILAPAVDAVDEIMEQWSLWLRNRDGC